MTAVEAMPTLARGPRPNSGGGASLADGDCRTVTPPAVPPRGKPRPLRGRPKPSSGARDMLSKVAPIWLGSGSKEEIIAVKDIKEVVPEDMHHNENVMAIERFENDAGPYEAQQKYVMAAECFEQAINLRRKFLGDSHPDFLAAIERYVVSCNLWGINCLNSGQYTVSLELLKKAEAMTEAENVPNFKRRVSLRAATFSNLCCYFRHRGKLNAALQFAEKALKIEQKFKDAENPARTHLNYAVLLSMMNRHDEAVEHIESAMAVLHDEERQISFQEQWASADHAGDNASNASVADNSKRHLEVVSVLVVAYYNMWVELTRLSRRELGTDFILRAANIANRKLGPNHVLTVKIQESLSVVQEQLAKMPNLAHHLQAACAFASANHVDDLTSSGSALHADLTHGFTAGGRPASNGGQLPPLESRLPWSPRGPETFAEVLEAHHITVRYEQPKRPPSRQPGEHKPFKRGFKKLHLQEHIYGRMMQPIPPEANDTFHSDARPKLSSTRDRGVFTGSPILQQVAHGATPRLLSSRAGREGAVSGAGFAAVDPTISAVGASGTAVGAGNLGEAPSATLQRSVGETAVVSSHLRAAYEYHKMRQQQKENFNGGEVAVPPDSGRLGAISEFRTRLEQRRERGLQAPTDANRARAATKIQARLRGYLVRLWDLQELARDARRMRMLEEKHLEKDADAEEARIASATEIRDVVVADTGFCAQRSVIEAPALLKDPEGPPDMKRRVALRVVYAARRAFVEYSCAVKIQKTWRGWVTRRDIQFEISHMAQVTATRIQALVRRASVCAHLSLANAAAVAIQGPWRRWIARRLACARRTSARTITRAALRYRVRRHLRGQGDAALPIQRSVRVYFERCRLKERQRGALAFEKAFRGWRCRRRIAGMLSAASLIAALWRGHAARRRLKLQNVVAGAIQRRFRFHRASCKQAARQLAAARIGAAWRGHQGRKWKPFRSSACKIQAFVRSVQTRNRLRQRPRAARRIQNFWRSYRSSCRFKTLVALSIAMQKLARWHCAQWQLRRTAAATVLCQRYARGYRTRNQLKHINANVTRLQAYWRSMQTRWRIAQVSLVAQRIQTAFRRFSDKRRFRMYRAAVARIRSGWFAYLTRKRLQRRSFFSLTLTTAYRGHYIRKTLRKALENAMIIQKWWRYCSTRWVRRQNLAATKIQAVWRGRIQVSCFVEVRIVALALQKLWRQRSARRNFSRMRRFCIRMQSLWRGYKQRDQIAVQHRAAVCIQCLWRQRQRRIRMQKQYESARQIQASVCGIIARRRCLREQRACTQIQRYVRNFLVAPIRKRRAAANRIRAWMCGRLCRLRYLKILNATVVMQKHSRFWQARTRLSRLEHLLNTLKANHKLRRQANIWRRKTSSAVLIQRVWRGTIDRKRLRCRCRNAVQLQSVARRWLAIRNVNRLTKAAIVLQKYWRRHLQKNKLKACRTIQVILASKWRSYQTRLYVSYTRITSAKRIMRCLKVFVALRSIRVADRAARLIQKLVRGHLARKRANFIRYEATLPIQCFVRRMKAVAHTERLRMQAYRAEVRGALDRKNRQERTKYEAATRIQSCQRMRRARNRYQHATRWALPKIQAFNRMIIDRVDFREQIAASISIQKCVRAFVLLKVQRSQEAAVTIQRGLRQYLTHRCPERFQFNDALEQNNAARVLQASWRRFRERWQYMRKIVGAVRIQAAGRMFLAKLKWKKKRSAAIKIQVSLMKPKLAHNAVQERVQNVLKLQALAEGGLTRLNLKQRLQKVIMIQACWRSALSRSLLTQRQYLAAVRIQANLRMCYNRKVAYPKRKAALQRIQAHARGYLVRKHLAAHNAAARQIQQKVRLTRFRHVMATIKWLVLSLQRIFRAGKSRAQTSFAVQRLRRIPARVRGRSFRVRHWPALVTAATAIQRIVRGVFARRTFERRCQAALRLQTERRKVLAQRILRRARTAVNRIAAAYRSTKHRDEVESLRHLYLSAQDAFDVHEPSIARTRARKATIMIQRFARGMNSRHHLWRMQRAAVQIQSIIRGRKACILLDKRRKALFAIQAHIDGAYQRWKRPDRYAKLILIQAHVKMRFATKAFQEKKRAQIDIARIYRGRCGRHKAERELRIHHVLYGGIQSMVVRLKYLRKVRAALLIQACWRGWLIRDEIAIWKPAATKIETAWRRSKMRRRHIRRSRAGHVIVNAAITWRHIGLRHDRARAVTAIAAAWHSYCVRRNLGHMQTAAEKIQTGWRHVKDMRDYQALSVEVLVKAKMIRDDYRTRHALVIQRCFRKWYRRRHAPIRKQIRAAKMIQSCFRRNLAQRHAYILRSALPVRLDRLLSRPVVLVPDRRGRLTRHRELQHALPEETVDEEWHHDRDGVSVVQVVRQMVCARALSEQQRLAVYEVVAPIQTFAKTHYYASCVQKIQRMWRAHLVRKTMAKKKAAAILLQANWRRCLAVSKKRRVTYLLTRFQAHVRGAHHRSQILTQMGSCVSEGELH